MNQIPYSYSVSTIKKQESMFTFMGNLRQFNNASLAYRAESTCNGIMYIIWKEFGNWWRVERWKLNVDYDYARTQSWRELENLLPKQIVASDDWRIFNYIGW